MVGVTLR